MNVDEGSGSGRRRSGIVAQVHDAAEGSPGIGNQSRTQLHDQDPDQHRRRRPPPSPPGSHLPLQRRRRLCPTLYQPQGTVINPQIIHRLTD